MACLVAAYKSMNGAGTKPRTELTLMIRPPPCSRMWGSTARVIRIEPKTLVSNSARACSIELSSAAPAMPKPALLTSTSMRPDRSSSSRTAAATEASSVTSSGRNTTPPRVSPAAALRLVPYTVNPAPSSARAAASPIPPDAPVTSATRPASIDICHSFSRLRSSAARAGAGGDCPSAARDSPHLDSGSRGDRDQLAALCGLGVLAGGAAGHQHDREDRAGDRYPGAGEEGVLEALGQRDRRRLAGGHGVVGTAVGDGGEDRQAERAADLLRRVDQARGQTGLVRLDAADRSDGHRDEREAEADRGEQRREQDVADEAAVHADLREPDQAGGGDDQAGDQHRLEAEAGDQWGARAGCEDDADGERQVRDAGLECRVPEHVLHVQRDEEEHGEQRGGDQDGGHVDAGDRAHPEDARERDERGLLAALDQVETTHQREREPAEAERLRRAPAGAVRVDQRVDEQ